MFLITFRITNYFSLDDINRFVFTIDTITVYFLLPGYDAVYSFPYCVCQTSGCFYTSPCDLKNAIPT